MSGIMSMLLGAVSSAITDVYFNLVTLLLPGNGTNGAQNNTFLDSSTNNFTITRNGNTTQGTFSPFSQTGWSNYFDGSGDYLSAPSSADFGFGTGDFTLECWVYPLASTAQRILFGGGDMNNIDIGFSPANTFQYYNGSVQDTGISAATKQWFHIAVSRTSGTTSVYVNGTRTNNFSDTSSTSTRQYYIGGSNTGTNPFNGYISNARIIKGAGIYSGTTITVPTTPLTAVTNTVLLTCQSNRFIDNSTNAFAITRNGDTSVQAFSPFAPTAAYSAATVGGSGYFDGTGDYLSVPASSQFLPGVNTDFTFEAWVYLTAAPSAQGATVVGTGEYGTTSDWSIAIDSSRFPFFYFAVPPGGFAITSSTAINVNSWNHIAVTRSGTGSNNLKMFLNGVNVAQASRNDTMDYTGNNLSIGADENGDESVLTGYISGLRLMNGTGYTSISVPTAPPTNITNTVLLLNFTNAGITDATAKNVLETVGNAQISTTQSKFGGSSMSFDGNGDYLRFPNGSFVQFNAGDFTIEAQLYLNTTTGNQTIIDCRPGTAGNYILLHYTSNSLNVFINGSTVITGGSLTANVWNHIALARSGTSMKLFVNGTQVGSTATNSTNFANPGNGYPFIGSNYVPNDYLNGFLDDLRITNGVARYTANFTAPTSAFALQ